LKIRIDENSLNYFSKNLMILKEPLARVLFYRGYYEMVFDGLISSNKFIKTC
jgi:hypothetical protein